MVARLLFLLLLVFVAAASFGQPASESTDSKALTAKVVKAAGGEDKLLKLFRMKEEYTNAAEPKPKGKGTPRVSILEAPRHWWVGGKERPNEEQSKNVVWAWTLGALTDPMTKVEVIPDVTENEKPAFGLRISGTVKPALDLYFDKEHSRLVRIDDHGNIYRFSEWKEHYGARYPAKTIMFRKATGKPWFHHEILEIERLKELPKELKPGRVEGG